MAGYDARGRSMTCIIDGESATTGQDAIASCRESTNLPKPPLWGIRGTHHGAKPIERARG